MNVELVEVFRVSNLNHENTAQSKQAFSLRKIFVNPKHVVCMRTDETMHQRLDEGFLPSELDPRQGFTKLYINRGQSGLDVTVIGNPEVVQQKIDETSISQQRVLLKG
jgi:hypothetical protein|tara:strand:- start:861 stop:1184 length:324 start_codon:yes stop_codon:yes gene_type:complete